MDTHVVGVLGGGQLGRMLIEAAHRLNIKVIILDAPKAPAKQINALSDHVDGSFKNSSDVRTLRSRCDVITYEIEHVEIQALEELEAEEPHISGLNWSFVQPHWRSVKMDSGQVSTEAALCKSWRANCRVDCGWNFSASRSSGHRQPVGWISADAEDTKGCNQAKENKVYEMALRLMDHVGSEERALRGMASD